MTGASPPRPLWPADRDIACVVLCGGKGSRLFPLTIRHQKSMLPVLGRPILQHVIDFWRQWADRFVFVVKHRKLEVEEYVDSLDLRAQCVEPEELTGIADGIYRARELVGEHFIVVLGDCICSGTLRFPTQMDQGIVVWRTDHAEDIRRSYSVELDGELVRRVVEKPTILPTTCAVPAITFSTAAYSGTSSVSSPASCVARRRLPTCCSPWSAPVNPSGPCGWRGGMSTSLFRRT